MEFSQLLNYSLPILVMAAIVMVLVGMVKVFIKPKIVNTWLSRLYFFLAVLFSVGVVALYYCLILKTPPFVSFKFFTEAGTVMGATQVLYPLYRKYGGRKVFLWFLGLLKGQNVDLDEIIEIVEKVLSENVVLVGEQEQNIHNELIKNLKT